MADYDVAQKIRDYKAQTEKNGFTWGDDASFKAHSKKYGNKTNAELEDEARIRLKAFNYALEDFNHVNHARARARFRDEYSNSKDLMLQKIRQQVNFENGRLKDQYPMRDASYENRVLTPKQQITSSYQSGTLNAFRQLMKAKWDCCGYYGDDSEIIEFERNYGPI
jgi:hypothetical protein